MLAPPLPLIVDPMLLDRTNHLEVILHPVSMTKMECQSMEQSLLES